MINQISTHDVLFDEVQRFRQPWLWALLGGGFLASGGGLAWGLAAEPEMAGHALIPAVCFVLLWGAVCLFLFLLKMDVRVDRQHLHVRFFPLLTKDIPLDDISEWETRTYRPLLEYGGWGIRYSLSKGWAYNVSGNRGLQLVMKDGKRLLIGSQKADDLSAAIGSAKQL